MKKFIMFSVTSMVILLSGCILFESVDQPTSALPGEAFTVSIDVITEGGGYSPFFGVCLPNGWTITGDSIGCTGVYNGTIYFDSYISSEQENVSPAPEGYYWWAGAGGGVDTNSGDVNGQFDIQTDDQLGLFSLDYMLGHSGGYGAHDFGGNKDRSDNHLIEVIDEYTPGDLQAIVEETSVVLNWNTPNITEGLMGYNIYRDEQVVNQNMVLETTYTDADPPNGTHYYAVSSLYDNGSEHLMLYRLPVIFGNIFVSPEGDNTNSGTSFDDAFLTISYAISIVALDPSHPITVFLAPGVYSSNTTGEQFPIAFVDYVSIVGSGEEETILDAENQSTVLEFVNINNNSVQDLTISNGSSGGAYYGGGIYCSNSSPSIVNVTITGNYAYYGGGIYCKNQSSPILVNVTISGNSATRGGGIYCINQSSPSLTNVTISANSVSSQFAGGYGGGIYSDGSSPSLVNVTISGNSADDHGGGICCSSDSSPSLVNCILWNDTPQEIYFFSSSVTATYSNIQGDWTGEGNINEDPLFIETGDHPYSLLEDSPCIDAGTPDTTGLNLPPWDIIGNERIWDGDGNGIAIIDMGAYEYGAPPYTEADEPIISNSTQPISNLKNYPNPFNPTTTISFELTTENTEDAELVIYNIKGQKIRKYSISNIPRTVIHSLRGRQYSITNDQYSVTWDGTDDQNKPVTSGIYLYKLQTGKEVITKKMILLK